MNKEKNPLGRGLDSLLGGNKEKSHQEIHQIKINSLEPGQFQPRSRMHKATLDELAESIKEQGVIQPIVVRKKASGTYEIVVGERRWRAAQSAGLESIPAIIKNLDNEEAAKMALIENLQREDLNAMDQARGLKRLQMEFNLSQEGLGRAIGKSRPAISNLLRLNNLSHAVQEMLEEGKINMGHARPLLSLEEKEQPQAAELIVAKKMSAREAERLVSQIKNPKKSRKTDLKKDANIIQLEREISEVLGANTKITHTIKGKGNITISFTSLEALQGILRKIKQ